MWFLILSLIITNVLSNPMLPTFRTRLITATAPRGKSATSADRLGPIPALYRVTLNNGRICQNTGCSIATNSFGTTGVVDYTFNDTHRNIQGRSTQTILTCRCLNENCSTATPMQVLKKGNESVCAMWESGGDCFQEILRETGVEVKAEDVMYGSYDPQTKDYWRAEGTRVMNLSCETNNWASLSELKADNAGKSFECTEDTKLIEDPTEGCLTDYNDILTKARYLSSQQDCYAVAKRKGTLLSPASGTLVSDVELALSCSAATLGILFVWSLHCKGVKHKGWKRVICIVVQVVSYALDALALHAVLGQEIEGRDWWSPFAFIDAVGGGGVLGIVIVVGEVRFRETRVAKIAAIIGIFDVFAAGIICLTILGVGRKKSGETVTLGGKWDALLRKSRLSEPESTETGDSNEDLNGKELSVQIEGHGGT